VGLFGKIKNGIKSKANAALDKAIDPAKAIDLTILELEKQQKQAYQELIAYKATAKSMEQDLQKYEEKVKTWEERAMAAVRKGDDETARECLREKKSAAIELAKIKRDRDEAAGYAIQLNRSRKDAETKLRILKLKKGTLATQLAAARSGTGNALGLDDEVFDRFARAEDKIENEAAMAEVDAELGAEAAEASIDAKLLRAADAAAEMPVAELPGDPLAELKAKMAADKVKRLKK
jgi:phage shock protein A